MKPLTRWGILGLVAVAIGVLLLLWSQREQPQAPDEAKLAAQSPAPALAAPKPEAPAVPSTAHAPPVTVTVLFELDRSVLRSAEAAKLDELADNIKGKRSVTGATCADKGLERAANRMLIDCLQPDRRASIDVVGLR